MGLSCCPVEEHIWCLGAKNVQTHFESFGLKPPCVVEETQEDFIQHVFLSWGLFSLLVHSVDKHEVECERGRLPRTDLDCWSRKSLMNCFQDPRLLLLVRTCDGFSHGLPWLGGQTTTQRNTWCLNPNHNTPTTGTCYCWLFLCLIFLRADKNQTVIHYMESM